MSSGITAPPSLSGQSNAMVNSNSEIAMLKGKINQKKREMEESQDPKSKQEMRAELKEMEAQLAALEAKRDNENKAAKPEKGKLANVGQRNFDASTPFGSRVMWA